MQSGLLLMPGAFASAVTMIIMGKVSGRFDARVLIAIGALVTVATALLLATINPDTGTGSLFLPLLLRGIGAVMIFVPLSLATLGALPKREIAAGSGIYSLTRQMGSSIGIAVITTVLARREALHRAGLVEHITTANPAMILRGQYLGELFATRSADPVLARQQMWSALDHAVNSQSLLLSFAEVFFYVAAAFLASLPLLLLLDKGSNQTAAAAAH